MLQDFVMFIMFWAFPCRAGLYAASPRSAPLHCGLSATIPNAGLRSKGSCICGSVGHHDKYNNSLFSCLSENLHERRTMLASTMAMDLL